MIVAANIVYLVPVESGQPVVLFKAQQGNEGVDFWFEQQGDDSVIVVRDDLDEHYFSRDGAALSGPACPGSLSPDGRYAAAQDGRQYYVYIAGYVPLDNPWPSVVIIDAETCAPIFRVRSAHTRSTGWLSTSEGLVVGVDYGYAIARVLPAPDLTPLPSASPYGQWGWSGPALAPTGGGRFFGYGPRVYDAVEDRWRGPADVGWGPFGWGDSHRERWFSIGYEGEPRRLWFLLPPKIEFPPFADEIAFRVARTGSCLRLREEPGEASRVLGCLPDGERLLLAERSVLPSAPSGSSFTISMQSWVYVRAAGGAEGWVSHGYLDHD